MSFNSIFDNSQITITSFLIVILSAIIIGAVFSLVNSIKSDSSKSFYVTTAMIPTAVAMVIMLVNGNIGAGVAVAGAFSLVRFRSAPGNAKEIVVIFIAMAIGLALGMGYIWYAVIFAVTSSLALFILSILNVFSFKARDTEKVLKIMIPEDLDYPTIFDDIFEKYLSKVELVKVKSKNMGSMFKLTYNITLKDVKLEKAMIDEIRCRNGNLEIMVSRKDTVKEL